MDDLQRKRWQERASLGNNARIYAQEHFQTWEERTAMEVKLVEELVGKGG